MKPIMAIKYFSNSIEWAEKEVVVFKESRMEPAPEIAGVTGVWEYFEVHEPTTAITTYAVDEQGFLYALTDSADLNVKRVSVGQCRINERWYNRSERLEIRL